MLNSLHHTPGILKVHGSARYPCNFISHLFRGVAGRIYHHLRRSDIRAHVGIQTLDVRKRTPTRSTPVDLIRFLLNRPRGVGHYGVASLTHLVFMVHVDVPRAIALGCIVFAARVVLRVWLHRVQHLVLGVALIRVHGGAQHLLVHIAVLTELLHDLLGRHHAVPVSRVYLVVIVLGKVHLAKVLKQEHLTLVRGIPVAVKRRRAESAGVAHELEHLPVEVAGGQQRLACLHRLGCP